MSTCRTTWRNAARAAALCAGLAGAAPAQVAPSGGQADLTFYFAVRGYGAGGTFEEPSALAVDERAGLVYVADTKAGVVDAFSLQGVPKFQYGSREGLKAPLGVAVDGAGNLFVSEKEGGPIRVIDARGKASDLAVPAGEGGEAPTPGRMTIDRDGSLYVVDRANGQVIVFDKERKVRLRFGGIGEKRGEFKLLHDVAVDRQGRIYAADAMGVPVQVFDRKGGYIQRFGEHGDTGDRLGFPAGVFADRQDQIWVVDRTRHCLRVYDRIGTSLRTFGTYGQGEGQLFYPVDAAEDSLGRVYVLEFGSRRLQVFRLSRPFEPFSPDTP